MKTKKPKLWSSRKADLNMSHWVRDRDKSRCFFCGKQGSQNSHFWGRGSSAVRYDPLNCDYACGGCHMRNEGSKQGLYRDMKLGQLGVKVYTELEHRARSIMKRSDAIIQLMSWLK